MRRFILLCVLASTGADWKDDPKMVEFYNKLNATHTKVQPTNNNRTLTSEPEVLSKHVTQSDVTIDIKETLATVKSINSRMILLENNYVAMSHQLTNLESRLTSLERGSVQPFRAPSRLSDPVAAQVAGRQVGMYDQFGRFITPVQQSAAIQTTPAATIVHQSVPMQVLQQPIMAISAFQYSVSGSGCSGGSCRRPGIFRRR